MQDNAFFDYEDYLETLEHLLLTFLRAGCRRLVAPDEDLVSGLYLRGIAISKQEVALLLGEEEDSFWGSDTDKTAFLLEQQTNDFFRRLNGDESFPMEQLRRTFPLDHLAFFTMLLSFFFLRNRKYERLYGFLQDETAGSRPTLGLAVFLYGLCRPVTGAQLYALLNDPRLSFLLLDTVEHSQPLKSPLRIPEYLFCFLEQIDYCPDETIAQIIHPLGEAFPEGADLPRLSQLTAQTRAARELDEPVVFYLSGVHGIGKGYSVRAVANQLQLDCYELDLDRFLRREEGQRRQVQDNLLAYLLLHEGLLHLKSRAESELQAEAVSDLLHTFTRYLSPLFLSDCRENDLFSGEDFLLKKLRFEMPRGNLSLRYWQLLSQGYRLHSDLPALASKFILTPQQIIHSLKDARLSCDSEDGSLSDALLTQAIQRSCTRKLRQHATLIAQSYQWDDLMLEKKSKEILRHVVNRVKYNQLVFNQYGFDRKVAYGKGTSILFYGPPGTGKTMGAQVLAREIGLQLYRIDLSQTISKYIGETEKNLGMIFDHAKYMNGILFFDEADALFAKRTEVKETQDRYANIETSYLLQRIEEHEGVCILATNQAGNFDDAFKRRIHYMVEFPMPNYEMRLRLWKQILPAELPCAGKIDFEFLAKNFEYSGSLIKNVLLSAAYIAVGRGKGVSMAEILEAAKLESAKIGKILWPSDLGQYANLLAAE